MRTLWARKSGFLLVCCGATTVFWFGCGSPAYTIPQDSHAEANGGTAGSKTLPNLAAVAGREAQTYLRSNAGGGNQTETEAFSSVPGETSDDSCKDRCDLPHAALVNCDGETCTLVQCRDGWADCNEISDDGCEVNVGADPAHCGNCGLSCGTANGTATCSQGQCKITCASGYADCDSVEANGCETNLMLSVKHCGECGRVCKDATNGTAICRAGNCELSNCAAPYGDCDGNTSNGCESDGSSDVRNCGGCGVSCSLPHATASCASRSCVVQACDEGWADCNGIAVDGCEIQLSSNPSHCGTCGTVCAPPAGEGACLKGQCAIGSCNPGTGDCNLQLGDGCETDLQSDLANCGACGGACEAVNGTPSCEAGSCSIACDSGYADCDANASNGCETETLTNNDHCGGCGRLCKGKCLEGICYTSPCSGICGDPKVITVGASAVSGIAKRVCHESYQATKLFTSGNCGLFSPGRILYVNGVAVACDGESWFTAATRPTPRYGGYCFHDDQSGGNGESAWFTVW